MRKRAKLKQQELADLLNVERSTVAKWEIGAAYPSSRRWQRRCNAASTISTPRARRARQMLTDDGRQLRVMLLELLGCAAGLAAATIGALNGLL